LPGGSQHGFLFDTKTQTYSFLDNPNAAITGLSITQITGVNNAGEIAGFYVDATTRIQRVFFATPAPAAAEPSTFTLLLVGHACPSASFPDVIFCFVKAVDRGRHRSSPQFAFSLTIPDPWCRNSRIRCLQALPDTPF